MAFIHISPRKMKRTPIIVPGQVYLHTSLEQYVPRDPFDILVGCEQQHVNQRQEYLVVTKAIQGDIFFRGNGFKGMNEVESFLERFGPVDPEDLTPEEMHELCALIPGVPLSTGWVEPEEEEE